MADYYVSTLGNDSTGNGTVGNPYATPGKANAVAIAAATAGYRLIVKNDGTYTTTTNTANVAGGRLDFTLSGTQAAFNKLIGYTSTVGDGGRFTFALGSGLTGPLINTNNANSYHDIRNVNLVGNATANAVAITHSGRSNRLLNWKASGFSPGAGVSIVSIGNNAKIAFFEISGGNTGNGAALVINTSNALVSDGWIHGNAGRGVDISANASIRLARVVSCDHTGANGYGFFIQATTEVEFDHCYEWNNAAGGYVLFGANPSVILHKCVSGGGGGYNVDNRSNADAVIMRYCALKANTTGLYPVTPNEVTGNVTLTGDPATDRANGNFAPNSTAGAGASLKAILEAIISGATNSYADIGPAQSEGSSGGAAPVGGAEPVGSGDDL